MMINRSHHQHNNCLNCVNHWWRWAMMQIKHPISGFQDKKNPDGTPFSYRQQKQATNMQIYFIIYDLCRRGKSSTSIQSVIEAFL